MTQPPDKPQRSRFWPGLVIGIIVGAAGVILLGQLLWNPPFG